MAKPRKDTRLPWVATAAVLCATVVLSTGVSASRQAEATGCPPEYRRAKATAARLIEQWPVRPQSDPATVYVQQLAARLMAVSSRAGQPVLVSLVRDRQPNAFAVGGNMFFITDGALLFARNEVELSAIVAHELAHELLGHLCPKVPTMMDSVLGLIFTESNSTRRIQAHGALLQTIDVEREQQADSIALQLLAAAGFDPGALVGVVQRLMEVAASPDGRSSLVARLARLRAFAPAWTYEARVAEPSFVSVRDSVAREFGSQVSSSPP